MQDWFADQEVLQYKLGVEFDQRLVEQVPEINASLPDQHGGYCMICYDELSEENSFALEGCKHTFCKACQLDYLRAQINAGWEGIDSNCMQQGCNLKVGHSIFGQFLDEYKEDRQKYWKWLIKSLTDQNKDIKWCPDPKCELSAEKTNTTRNI